MSLTPLMKSYLSCVAQRQGPKVGAGFGIRDRSGGIVGWVAMAKPALAPPPKGLMDFASLGWHGARRARLCPPYACDSVDRKGVLVAVLLCHFRGEPFSGEPPRCPQRRVHKGVSTKACRQRHAEAATKGKIGLSAESVRKSHYAQSTSTVTASLYISTPS